MEKQKDEENKDLIENRGIELVDVLNKSKLSLKSSHSIKFDNKIILNENHFSEIDALKNLDKDSEQVHIKEDMSKFEGEEKKTLNHADQNEQLRNYDENIELKAIIAPSEHTPININQDGKNESVVSPDQQFPIKKRVTERIRSLIKKPSQKSIPCVDTRYKVIEQINKNEVKITDPVVLPQTNIFKKTVIDFLENSYTTTFFTILTLYALFADDAKMTSLDITYDKTFSIIIIIVIVLFTIELILNSIFVDKYFKSFFFYLDLISILSLFLDIHWIYNAMILPDANNYSYYLQQANELKNANNSTLNKGTVAATVNNKQGVNLNNVAQFAKATRGTRAGSRAIRIIRVIRLIRLIRIAKTYKEQKEMALKKKNIIVGSNEKEHPQKEQILPPEESRVGKKLMEKTTKKIVVLVLLVMIAVLLFDPNLYIENVTSMSLGIQFFNYFNNVMDPDLYKAFTIYVDEHKNTSAPIVYARAINISWGNNIYYMFREGEKIEVSDACTNLAPSSDPSHGCYGLFDNRNFSRLDSGLNIIKTVFICMVLSIATLSFSNDTNELVLGPIEKMINNVKNISENPIDAMQKAEEDEVVSNFATNEETKNDCCSIKNDKEAPLETTILSKTIAKIGGLLALVFGSAGSEIIAKNMQNNEGDVNPMIQGKKVIAIYGFCDIRNFTDTTEVLQENVMIFVNEIAEIVHDIASQYSGSANKNIGDAFLLVWKFEDRFYEILPNGELMLPDSPEVSQVIDMSVVAFVKILQKIYKSSKLDKYRKNVGLNERINNYSVKLGFGLHVGWSIEGAIGSSFKIDASYLSPNVNMASKLEEKTKDYGAQLILSGPLVSKMTADARKYVRPIDKIKFNSGDDAVIIYTIDLDMSVLTIEDESILKPEESNNFDPKFEKVLKRAERKLFYDQTVHDKTKQAWSELENDEEFLMMRRKYKPEFYEVYNKAFKMYLEGDWENAKENFEKAQEILGEKDGPSKNILEFMGEQKFKSKEWHGFKSDAGH